MRRFTMICHQATSLANRRTLAGFRCLGANRKKVTIGIGLTVVRRFMITVLYQKLW